MAAIPSNLVIDIYLQVMAGEDPPENEHPRLAEYRERLTREVAKLREQGVELEIPYDYDSSDEDD